MARGAGQTRSAGGTAPGEPDGVARALARPPRARPAGGRVRLARAQRVDDILVAALQEFTERGYEAAAMADIAARCGVVEGTVYKYFDSKRGLMLAVLERWYEELFGNYTRELPGLPGARAKLRYLVWRHLRTFQDNPLLARLMFTQVRSQPDYRGSKLHAMNRRYAAMLTDVVAQGIAAGEIRPALSATMVRDLVYGGIEHLTASYLAGHGRLDVDGLADELTGLLWQGLDAGPAAASTAAAAASTAGDDRTTAMLDQQLTRLTRLADRLESAGLPARPRRPKA